MSVSAVGPGQYSIENCESAAECYEAANAQCVYGFTRLDGGSRIVRARPNGHIDSRSDLVIQCNAATFCADDSVCAEGYRCGPSQRFAGRNVCQR